MKLIQLLLFLFISASIFAQCPDGKVVLENQFQVDLFAEKYPDCEHMKGELTIGKDFGTSSIYDLSKMPRIKSIILLSIRRTQFVEDFSFLDKLVSIKSLQIVRNDNIESLEFLKNAVIDNQLTISNNYSLFDISDLSINSDSIQIVSIRENISLSSCSLDVLCDLLYREGLYFLFEDNAKGECENYFELSKNCDLGFPSNIDKPFYLYDQGDIDSLYIRFPDVSKIGYLIVAGGGENSNIIDLNPLEKLDSIGQLRFYDCDFTDLDNGLDSTYIGSLGFFGCNNLKNVDGLNRASALNYLTLNSCEELEDISAVDFNKLSTQSLTFENLPKLNSEILNLDSLNGNIFIRNLNWVNLYPFSRIKNAKDIRLWKMTNLLSLDGMERIETLRFLDLFVLSSLATLSGVDNLQVADEIRIESCPKLKGIENCFTNLESVTSEIRIRNNFILDTIAGFDNLSYVNSIEITSNLKLTNLDFLDHNIEIGRALSIENNILLNECDVEGLCLNLGVSEISISGNSDGCNSVSEIAYSCDAIMRNPNFDILISNQTDMDAFASKFPSADSIFANVTLSNADQSSPIIDVSYFDQIGYIKGELSLSNFSQNHLFQVFSDIHFGSLKMHDSDITDMPYLGDIDSLRSLTIMGCNNLNHIDSLAGIKQIHNLIVVGCNSIQSLNGLDSLKGLSTFAIFNSEIQDLSALEEVERIENMAFFGASGFGSLEELASLRDIGILNIQQGSLNKLFAENQINTVNSININNVQSLNQIIGFERVEEINSLTLQSNSLTVIDGFENLRTILSGLTIKNSSAQFIEFPKLEKIKTFQFEDNLISNLVDVVKFTDSVSFNSVLILNNSNLSICNVPWLCEHIESGMKISVSGNGEGCNELSDISIHCGDYVRCPTGDISIQSNEDLDRYIDNYNSCKILPSDFFLDAGQDYVGLLDSLVGIVGGLTITNHNESVITPNLKFVRSAEFISMERDFQLDFQFENLFDLSISGSSMLDSLRINAPEMYLFYFINNDNIKFLEIVESEPEYSYFRINNNKDLETISGSNNDMMLAGLRILNNNSLENLKGFDNSKFIESERVFITGNPKLDVCNIAPICNLNDDHEDVNISNNGDFCSNLDTIKLVCDGIISSADEVMTIDNLIIFPNPTDGNVYFQDKTRTKNSFSGTVYNSWGQKMLNFQNVGMISLDNMNSGIYFIRMDDGKLFKVIMAR